MLVFPIILCYYPEVSFLSFVRMSRVSLMMWREEKMLASNFIVIAATVNHDICTKG